MLGLYDRQMLEPAVYFATHDPAHIVKTCAANDKAGSMSCTVLAVNATLPLHSYTADFPFAVTALTPRADWWDISQIYRAWVLPHAEWTKLGSLEERLAAGALPSWLPNITLWVNNNWGGDPLGPNYGGDPAHVEEEMLAFNRVLDLGRGSLGLHWYEWDTLGYAFGSNHTQCDRPPAPGIKHANCGFDTHYPNYFPARKGCKESVASMQAAGMRIIPYINGQLYDTGLPRFAAENASAAVQKFQAETMATSLSPHLEHFDGITSAVMCPHTQYWRNILTQTIVKACDDIGFDGVYVDQVGNGEQRNCADPSHGHSINGGAFWAQAFYWIMADVRSTVQRPSIFMTEGIVEEVSGAGFDIMLGLHESSGGGTAVWHAVYGGYSLATGHAVAKIGPLASGMLTALTTQFMLGGTMGWFTYQDYCAPETGCQFLNPANAAYVAYIRLLSDARLAATEWMMHGHLTRDLVLDASSTELMGACFLRDAQPARAASVVCALALPTNSSASSTFALSMEPARYGLTAERTVSLTDLWTGAKLGHYAPGSKVTYAAEVPAFGVSLLRLVQHPDVEGLGGGILTDRPAEDVRNGTVAAPPV